MAVVTAVVGVLVAGLSALLVGASVAALFAGGSGFIVGLVVAGALCLVLPVLIERQLTLAFRKLQPGAKGMFFQTLGIVNAVWLALLVLLSPRFARSALEQRGPAFVPGAPKAWFARAAALIPRSDRPAPLPRASVARPPAPSVSAATTASEQKAPLPLPTSSAIREAPEADSESPAAKVYRERASGVVVIHTRSAISAEGPLAKLYDRLGVPYQEGLGSGFIVAEDGLIVTNHHVVEGATELQVVLKDGSHFDDVSILRDDSRDDLALLSIPTKGLPAVPLSQSKDIAVGARAIAIGSPLGFEYTLTEGIVSAHRNIDGTRFLQMQTTVAPGSSGGPLFDDHGAVIGVNTAGGGAAGLNLAVHVAEVRKLLAAPRKAKTLAHYVPSARVASLEAEGTDLDPTTRLNLRESANLLANVSVKCGKDLADGTEINVTLPQGLTGTPQVASGLPKEAQECMTMALTLIGMQLSMTFMQMEKPPAALHIAITDLPRESGKPASLVYHFKR